MSCPYLGLVPLSQEDQPFFAGRQKEIKMVISSLYGSSLTILFGESGVGKTSLIRAGILPELEHPEHRVAAILFREWQLPDFDISLRKAALNSLLRALNRLIEQGETSAKPLDEDTFLEKFLQGLNLSDSDLNLKTAEDLYKLPLDRFIKACCEAFYGRLFFVFDQFEEYIFYHPLKEKGEFFDAELARAINDRSVPASFLISLREDGLGKLNRLRERIPDLLGNVIKLEHLDKDGAVEAMNKPLSVFNEKEGFEVTLAPELVDAILEQADADRLEMEEPFHAEANEKEDKKADRDSQSDIGPRYKAMALQAVLLRLWNANVEPALSRPIENGKKICVSTDALTQLVEGKPKGESDVRFVLRTYFDQQLQSLEHEIQRDAVEILPLMIRAGGQKKARSVPPLVAESGIPQERVLTTLEKLSETPANIIRKVMGARGVLYELQHDTMAFALQDWCIRQRQAIGDERLKKDFEKRRNRAVLYTLIGTAVALIIIAVTIWSLIEQTRENAARAQAQAENLRAELNTALDSEGAGGTYNPSLGLIIGIDTVALFRESADPYPVPEQALLGLRLGTLQVGQNPADAAKNRDTSWAQIPAMVSPDQKYLLAIEPNNEIKIFTYNKPIKNALSYELPGKPPFEIGCSDYAQGLDRIGVRSSDGLVELWDFSGPTPRLLRESSGDLARDLGFSLQIGPGLWKKLSDPIDYESIVRTWILDGLSVLTRQYGEREPRLMLPPDAHLMSERYSEAVDAAKSGDAGRVRALSVLSDEFKQMHFEIEQRRIATVLAWSLVHRALLEKGEKNPEVCFKAAKMLAPEYEKAFDAQKEIARGNALAAKGDKEEAKAAYKNAKALDPSLPIDPESAINERSSPTPGS